MRRSLRLCEDTEWLVKAGKEPALTSQPPTSNLVPAHDPRTNKSCPAPTQPRLPVLCGTFCAARSCAAGDGVALGWGSEYGGRG